MSRFASTLLLLIAVCLSVAASLVLRYQLMESDQYVAVCASQPEALACQVRASLGWLIHFRVLAVGGLLLALLAFVLPGAWGRRLAGAALLISLPCLVLYSASVAVFSVVLALLRWVRVARSS